MKIGITGFGAFSAAGFSTDNQTISGGDTAIRKRTFSGKEEYVAPLGAKCENILNEIRAGNPNYTRLDRSVIMAIGAARQAIKTARWSDDKQVAVNIGSSRGPTQALENYFREFEASESGRVSAMASPFTTAGNIATWVSQDLQSNGLCFSHSLTCSTALHAIGNAMAWLKSGMCDYFLAGASEAPLTDFTIAQMKALRIYASGQSDHPCRPFNMQSNTMVLGEAASVFCMEKKETFDNKEPLAWISGFGTFTEAIASPTSVTSSGEAFYHAMQNAINNSGKKPDIILAHAPGTIAGDSAEWQAINRLFDHRKPYLYSNKWQIAHTLGAAGAMNVVTGLDIIQSGKVPLFPYPLSIEQHLPESVNNILINAMGFGGNAVSIMLSRP